MKISDERLEELVSGKAAELGRQRLGTQEGLDMAKELLAARKVVEAAQWVGELCLGGYLGNKSCLDVPDLVEPCYACRLRKPLSHYRETMGDE